jgi:hypothetical protein
MKSAALRTGFCSCSWPREGMNNVIIVPDGEESDVSGPIQSIKMDSCVQCAMQGKSVCCRDVLCLAHLEQGPNPSTQGTHPPPLSAGPLGT